MLAELYSSGDIMPTIDELEGDAEDFLSSDGSSLSSTMIELPGQDSDGLEYVMG